VQPENKSSFLPSHQTLITCQQHDVSDSRVDQAVMDGKAVKGGAGWLDVRVDSSKGCSQAGVCRAAKNTGAAQL